MRREVHSDPENVYVASGYKELGNTIEINRQRVVNVIASFTRETSEAAIRRMQEYADDYAITDQEKKALRMDLADLDGNYDNIVSETKDADFGDTYEFRAVRDAYTKIHDLLYKIVNYEGTYKGDDVGDIVPYYQDYVDKATILVNEIMLATSEAGKINTYYAKTKVGVDIIPESVAVNTSTTVYASVLYDGEEQIGNVDADTITFLVSGLANSVTSAMFAIPSGGSIDIDNVYHTAEITGCKTFQMNYYAIGQSGVKVDIDVTLDSDLMPF